MPRTSQKQKQKNTRLSKSHASVSIQKRKRSSLKRKYSRHLSKKQNRCSKRLTNKKKNYSKHIGGDLNLELLKQGWQIFRKSDNTVFSVIKEGLPSLCFLACLCNERSYPAIPYPAVILMNPTTNTIRGIYPIVLKVGQSDTNYEKVRGQPIIKINKRQVDKNDGTLKATNTSSMFSYLSSRADKISLLFANDANIELFLKDIQEFAEEKNTYNKLFVVSDWNRTKNNLIRPLVATRNAMRELVGLNTENQTAGPVLDTAKAATKLGVTSAGVGAAAGLGIAGAGAAAGLGIVGATTKAVTYDALRNAITNVKKTQAFVTGNTNAMAGLEKYSVRDISQFLKDTFGYNGSYEDLQKLLQDNKKKKKGYNPDDAVELHKLPTTEPPGMESGQKRANITVDIPTGLSEGDTFIVNEQVAPVAGSGSGSGSGAGAGTGSGAVPVAVPVPVAGSGSGAVPAAAAAEPSADAEAAAGAGAGQPATEEEWKEGGEQVVTVDPHQPPPKKKGDSGGRDESHTTTTTTSTRTTH